MATKTGRSQTFPFPTRRARIGRGEVAYFDEGQGPAVVFVHGLVGDFTHFEHVAPALAATHRVIGLDLPGCGLSSKQTSRHTIERYGRDVLELMSAIGVDRATLVGHSAGGLVSAKAALLAPSRVERLALISSAGLRRYSPLTQVLARGVLRPALLEATLERLAMPMLDQVFVVKNRHTEKFIVDALDRPIHPTLGEMAKVFADLGPDLVKPTILDELEGFAMPLLLLWGDSDRLVPSESAWELSQRLPRATLRMFPRVGHMPMIEVPEAVLHELTRFLGTRPHPAVRPAPRDAAAFAAPPA